MTEYGKEWRIVCAHFGDDGHQLHRFPKISREKAAQAVLDANHKAEITPDFYAACAPYRIQYRPLQDWTDDD